MAYLPVQNLSDEVLAFMHALLPEGSYELIEETLVDILETKRTGLLSLGLATALYFGTNGMHTLMDVYNRYDRRLFVVKRLRAILIVLGVGLLGLLSLSIYILGEIVLLYFIDHSPLPSSLSVSAVVFLQWFIVLFALYLTCIILYRFGDTRNERFRYVYPGAIVATISMVIISIGYAWYADNFANYNKLYGSLGALIITMLYIYFISIAIIAGHEVNRSLMQAGFHKVAKDMKSNPMVKHDSTKRPVITLQDVQERTSI